ncbi:hypothetical protein GALL_75590 [mine drainage metagenome]|uniref:Uncharacterized protein n=1 Tax=mine drainage metagenome TaxID=410659 RepID=A0A1J5TAH5_9ZZZZ
MSTDIPAKIPPHSFRRTADNTPASRAGTNTQNPPTSPKIHELRERYEALKEKKNGLNSG